MKHVTPALRMDASSCLQNKLYHMENLLQCTPFCGQVVSSFLLTTSNQPKTCDIWPAIRHASASEESKGKKNVCLSFLAPTAGKHPFPCPPGLNVSAT